MSKDAGDSPAPHRGEIGLGDLLTALEALDTSDPTIVETIAGALGFTGLEANPAEHTRGAADSQTGTVEAPAAATPPPGWFPELPPPLPELPDTVLPTTLHRLDPVFDQSARPAWLDEPPTTASQPRPPARAPLFPLRTAPGVLGAAVATPRSAGRPDVPALIRSLARGEPLSELPMLLESSLHRGAQLLLDTAEAMVPFLADLDDLVAALARVVGENGYQVFQFAGDPGAAVRRTRTRRTRPWRPDPGRPVVLATDFGAGAVPAARDRTPLPAWLAFLRRCQEVGCPVVALVPYPRERWPRALSRRMAIIHWHPRTRAAHVRRLLGAGLRVSP